MNEDLHNQSNADRVAVAFFSYSIEEMTRSFSRILQVTSVTTYFGTRVPAQS